VLPCPTDEPENRSHPLRLRTRPQAILRILPRWLETPLACPKCDATYNLAVDWDQSTDRWFPETSRPLITLLKKAIHMGHSTNHRVTHFETEGVIVESVTSTSTQ
jgi:hypothetical protein